MKNVNLSYCPYVVVCMKMNSKQQTSKYFCMKRVQTTAFESLQRGIVCTIDPVQYC